MMKHFTAVLVLGLVLAVTQVACHRQSKPGTSGEYGGSGGPLQRIHYDFDRSDIRPDAVPVLERNAAWIKDHAGKRVTVEGHCDDRGTNEYNMALGDRRSNAARDYLSNLGVDPSVLSSVSYGEERPLDPGSNESAWSLNRRAEFAVQ